MTPSPYQLAIFDHVRASGGNLVVDAKAGSGKTTTIVEALKLLPSRDPQTFLPPSVVFLAFNKSIAETLSARCPRHVSCSTFHSLGFRALKDAGAVARNVKVESGKCRKLVWDRMDRENPDIQSVIRLVSLLKQQFPPVETTDEVLDLASRFDLDLQEPQASARVALAVLDVSNRDLTQIDFDDMLYLPVIRNIPFQTYDWIFVDEAQDLNTIQHEILWRLQKPATAQPCSPTRLVAVGDPRQAIYGFRGASSNSMNELAERFRATVLPLSVCYRCSRAVISRAQRYVPDILPHSTAPEGSVQTLGQYGPQDFPVGSAVLCRNTAPLVGLAYGLLQRDVPCTILGRDIGANLIATVKKMRATDLKTLRDRLQAWASREAERAIAEGRSPEHFYDQQECLFFFISSLDEDSQGVSDLIAKIELMFSDPSGDNRNRVTLSTVHKAKGLEYPVVFLLDAAKLMPSRYATLPWQQEQERNLIYVAITRAQERLVYISSDCWKEVTV